MKIAIIGRPNVGKSTLFNRLVGKKLAIVGNVSGITRDRRSENAELFGLKFQLYDSPGIDPFSKDELARAMNAQSLAAIRESNIVVFVVDAISGITEYDKAVASWLRLSFSEVGNRPVILLKNKSEGKTFPEHFGMLGFGEGVAIAAEHNLGFEELYSSILQYFSEHIINGDIKAIEPPQEHQLKMAIVGRPNVGKSTLINAIIDEDRLLTGAQAGITRDAISVHWKFKNQNILIVDTAGQRKNTKIKDSIESVALLDAWRYIRQANVVVVAMDIQNPLEKQDITIARKAFEEGKILIFVLTKSDTVDIPQNVVKSVNARLEKEFAQIPRVPCLLVSAKKKLGLIRIFNTAFELFNIWSARITTGKLNKWFATALIQNPPPLVRGMPIKLKYIQQTNTKPPTFVIFANRAEHLPVSYERYLLNHMRQYFNLYGIPLRLFIRQRDNPHYKEHI